MGVVLGLKSEKMQHQTSVDKLIGKLEGFVKQESNYYEDVITLITDNKDVVPILETGKKNLFTEDKKKVINEGNLVEQIPMKDKITRYGNRKATLPVFARVCQAYNSLPYKELVSGITKHVIIYPRISVRVHIRCSE